MIVGLDTSVLMRLLTGTPQQLAVLALHYLQERQDAGDPIWVSDWVLAESYYALQHHYGASKKDTLLALKSFLDTPGIEGTGEVTEVLTTPKLETAKPGFIDRVIYKNYISAGAEQMVTFEKAAKRLPQTLVLAL